jgi:transposase-like protein
MKIICPNIVCKNEKIVKDGHYYRACDSKKVQRYQCRRCGKKFSKSTFQLEYRQKKRRVNIPLFKLLVSGVSLRRSAWILNIHPITVSKKLSYLAKKSRVEQQKLLGELEKQPVKNLQVDDLITCEHTKLKPLSVSTAIDSKTRLILRTEVSRIPAFGHLARISRKKYGVRVNEHPLGFNKLLKSIKAQIDPNAIIETDEHSLYPAIVKKHYPEATHLKFKSDKGSVSGQGELKKVKFDPLFSINHTHAMLRANISRLIRRSWCISKRPDMLKNHLEIYTLAHNSNILKRLRSSK